MITGTPVLMSQNGLISPKEEENRDEETEEKEKFEAHSFV